MAETKTGCSPGDEGIRPLRHASCMSSSSGTRTEPAVQDAWARRLRWRKAERKRLIDERSRLTLEERGARSYASLPASTWLSAR